MPVVRHRAVPDREQRVLGQLFGQGIVGLVTLYGGANSHMAIRAAEFGLPAAIGIGEQRYRELAQARVLELSPANGILRVVR